MPPPPPAACDHQDGAESLLWRCRDGPLASALAAAGGNEDHEERAAADQQQQQSSRKQAQEQEDNRDAAAFASASRDARVVLASSITSLRPTALLPESIARR
jgi:hypothetical protein